jgi:diguanylate cyclase (GGDEF)-like protein
MKSRRSAVGTKLAILAILALAILASAAAFFELRGLTGAAGHSFLSRQLSEAQAVKLYAELSFPGGWKSEGSYLYKGKERLADGPALRGALAGCIAPDAAILFEVGQPPAALPGPGVPAERARGEPDRPFMTDLGACVTVRDGTGSAAGWIAVRSASEQRGDREARSRLASLLGLAGLCLASALLLAALSLRLSRPIDHIAEADEAARSKLEGLSRRDRLTGLLNRRAIIEVAEDPLSMHGLSHVAILDIDDLRALGDERGEEACDRLLSDVARIVVSIVRGADLCGRWEGDELIVVYRGLAEEFVVVSGERLRSGVASRDYGSPGAPLRATITIGLAEIGPRGFEEAAEAAQAAMRTGKAEGRNRLVLASPRRAS